MESRIAGHGATPPVSARVAHSPLPTAATITVPTNNPVDSQPQPAVPVTQASEAAGRPSTAPRRQSEQTALRSSIRTLVELMTPTETDAAVTAAQLNHLTASGSAARAQELQSLVTALAGLPEGTPAYTRVLNRIDQLTELM